MPTNTPTNDPAEPQPYKFPVKPLHNPLSHDDEAIIHQILARLKIAEDIILRAADCGLDVAGRYEQHKMHEAVANKLKQRFFPDQLPTDQE